MDRTRRVGLRAVVLASLAAVMSAAPAAAAPTPVATVEAEQGTAGSWGINKVSDASATNRSAMQYDWGGSIRLTVKLPAFADGVTLRMRGDQCAGAPAYTATLDKAKLGSGTVATTAWSDQTLTRPLVAGTHVLEISFDNDLFQWSAPMCNRNLYLDTVTFTASGSPAPAPAVPAGFVHQSGTQLLDGANRPLRLRGVNLGGWLLWEGWIWGQGFDYIGESAMMRNLASLVGSATAEQFRSDVRANYVTGDDFRAMAAYGFNVARVNVNYRLLEDDGQPFAYKQSGWDALDRTVAAARQAGVYLVLEMHAAPCSQTYGFVSDYVGPDYLWFTPKCRDRTVALWKAIAARYAGENIVAGYDLLGESTTTDADLLSLYKRITAAVREVDSKHLLIYEGNNMARSFDLFTEPLDSNEMLSFHDYSLMVPGQDVTARMPSYDAAARRLNAPQWAGEFGQGGYEDVARYVSTFDNDPLVAGWAQWTWKQSPGLPALQTMQHTPASKKLVEWINNTSRPRPTAAEASQGMADFITVMKFENTQHDAKLLGLMR